WSFTPSTTLADGKYAFTVVATDKAGNVSVPSDAYGVTVKSTQTALEWFINDNYGPIQGRVEDGGVTDDNKRLSIFGYAPPELTVIIYGDGKELARVKPNANDKNYWNYTPSELKDGTYTWGVEFVDAAGNKSAYTTKTITVDTQIAKPTISNVIDDVGSITGSIANNGTTDDNKPTLSGTAEAGSTVTVKNGSTVLGTVKADASGNWTFTPGTALADGQYVFTVTAQDLAGNSATSDSHTITVATSSAKPTITAVTDDVGSITGTVANNGVTDDNKPTLSGKADAGSTVTVK
ncbi:Ig-like domain-containing protein, partial [Aeromonas hydrophila]|uniref:Ig-like domain-containing protein n=1 Tax=Aeromonas hydrophila TaxID=644 RepID=UPI0022AF9D5F